MKNYRSFFWLNSLFLLLVLALTGYEKLFGHSVSSLFLPPLTLPYPFMGSFTHIFQLLCTIPVSVCAFTFSLLISIKPRNTANLFILYSAVLTGGFLANEIFRIHIYLLMFASVAKLETVLVYAVVFLIYGLAFWRKIKSTPYVLLLSGIALLLFAIAVDSLHLRGDDIPSLLEGVPKLFSQLNIALYYWFVCQQEFQLLFNSDAK